MRYTTLFALLLFTLLPFAGKPQQVLPGKLKFEENKGQWDERVLYKADLRGGRLFLERSVLTYAFYSASAVEEAHHQPRERLSKIDIPCHAFKVRFDGASQAQVLGENRMEEISNYYIGDDPSKWGSNVQNYRGIQYRDLYPGIDLRLYSSSINLKYDLIVNPGASAQRIRMVYDGTDAISLKDGNLVIKTSVNEITEQKPYAYQLIDGQEVPVECAFALEGNTVSFDLPKGYNEKYPLVIDPIVMASTYAGTVVDTWGHCATYDSDGNIYAGGRAFGVGYPVTPGSYQQNFAGGTDIAISKLKPDGSSRLYSTYLGGSSDDAAHSMMANESSELYVYGSTMGGYPTANGYDNSFNGGMSDIFVSRLSSNGTALLGSTYIGGTGKDGMNRMFNGYGDDYRGEIYVDSTGSIFIATVTESSDFPTTGGAFDMSYNGGQDGCVFKLNAQLSSLMWSTFLGTSGNDAAHGVRSDRSGNTYVVGSTSNSNFPTTPSTYATSYKGGTSDAFLVNLTNNGSTLAASTFFGTSSTDQGFFVDRDTEGKVYIYGMAQSGLTPSPGVYSKPGSSAFIARFTPDLKQLDFQTVFGNGTASTPYTDAFNLPANYFSPSALMVDICGNIYASGWGSVSGYPLTPDAVQQNTDNNEFYIIVLTKDAAALSYGTYYGDASGTWEHVDGGTSRFDKNGIVYQAVCACGNNFPATANAISPNNNSPNCDVGIFKIDFQKLGVTAAATPSPASGCGPLAVNFINNSIGAVNYTWDFGDGSPLETVRQPVHTFQDPGTYQVMLIASDPAACRGLDTTYVSVTVYPRPVVNIGRDTTLCPGQTVTLNAGNPGASYQWSNGSTSQTITVGNGGTYIASVSYGTCTVRDTMRVTTMANLTLGNDIVVCEGTPLNIGFSVPGNNYVWSTGATTPTIDITAPGLYWVNITNGFCSLSDTVRVTFNPLPDLDLGPDTTICDPVLIDATTNANSYVWSTGATSPSITAGLTGTYWVRATLGGCSATDTIRVFSLGTITLGEDTTACAGTPLNIGFSDLPDVTYTWSTGQSTPYITVDDPGVYWVDVDNGLCRISDTITVVYTPQPSVELGIDTIICDPFTINLDPAGGTYLWSTGSSSSSLDVSETGTYWVRVNIGNCYDSDTLNVTAIEGFVIGNDTTVCEGDLVALSPSTAGDAYLWSTGDTTFSIVVSSTGPYWVNVTKGPCVFSDTVEVTFTPRPPLDLGADTVVCTATMVLDAGAGIGPYIWSTGDTTQQANILQSGSYWVMAGPEGCASRDTISIITTQVFTMGEDIPVCEGFPITIDAGVDAEKYLWSTGDTTRQMVVHHDGEYWIQVQTGECPQRDTVMVLRGDIAVTFFCPNAFTPNGDGINEVFTPVGVGIVEYKLQIFDRWGELFFETDNMMQGWDGTLDNTRVQQGVYVWIADYTTICDSDRRHRQVGHVLLYR